MGGHDKILAQIEDWRTRAQQPWNEIEITKRSSSRSEVEEWVIRIGLIGRLNQPKEE